MAETVAAQQLPPTEITQTQPAETKQKKKRAPSAGGGRSKSTTGGRSKSGQKKTLKRERTKTPARKDSKPRQASQGRKPRSSSTTKHSKGSSSSSSSGRTKAGAITASKKKVDKTGQTKPVKEGEDIQDLFHVYSEEEKKAMTGSASGRLPRAPIVRDLMKPKVKEEYKSFRFQKRGLSEVVQALEVHSQHKIMLAAFIAAQDNRTTIMPRDIQFVDKFFQLNAGNIQVIRDETNAKTAEIEQEKVEKGVEKILKAGNQWPSGLIAPESVKSLSKQEEKDLKKKEEHDRKKSEYEQRKAEYLRKKGDFMKTQVYIDATAKYHENQTEARKNRDKALSEKHAQRKKKAADATSTA